MPPTNHLVGSGSGTQDVPGTQEGGNSTIIPGPTVLVSVTFQAQVNIVSRGEIQNCRANLTSCADTSTPCPSPEPSPIASPIALPNAPKISFTFTRSDTDPETATDKMLLDALCFADGTWQSPLNSLTFSYVSRVSPDGSAKNPFSANASAIYTSDVNTFLSDTLVMPPFPDRSDDNTIPVLLTIDLDGEPTATIAN